MSSQKKQIEQVLQEHGFLPYIDPIRGGTGQSGFFVAPGEDISNPCHIYYRNAHPGTPLDTLDFLRDAKLRSYAAAFPPQEFTVKAITGTKAVGRPAIWLSLTCSPVKSRRGAYHRKVKK